jgi:uncharacterized protein YndB with AHSA1/START domain
MFVAIVAVIVVLVVALVGYAATRPDTFRVERSTTIKAPPGKIFPYINDFHQWGIWSPWEKLDPALRRTFTGAPRDKGAVYEWEGNAKAGKGRMEITEATPPSRVTIKLDFLKPFEAHNVAEFTLTGKGDTTDLTWTMYGARPFVVKLMTVFISMDALVGKDFETGLANLKAAAEK